MIKFIVYLLLQRHAVICHKNPSLFILTGHMLFAYQCSSFRCYHRFQALSAPNSFYLQDHICLAGIPRIIKYPPQVSSQMEVYTNLVCAQGSFGI